MADTLDAPGFTARVGALRAPVDVARARAFFRTDDDFVGARMGDVFALAKVFIDLPVDQIDALLDSPVHEVRVGALSIMGKQAARKSTPAARLEELYELYLRRIDRINTWDLVDLSAHHVVGGHLLDRSREPLHVLAGSPNWWERRVAVFATLRFIRAGDLDDTFALGGRLAADEHDLVQKVVGGVVREAGKRDRPRLLAFLDTHAAQAAPTVVRYAAEHLDKETRARYLRAAAPSPGPRQ